MSAAEPGVSFVVPVRNGASTLELALASMLAEARGCPTEILAVDDGSTDASPRILERLARTDRVRILRGRGQGAAAAINQGIRGARFERIAQVDQDVVLRPGWLGVLTAALDVAEDVAAAQAIYDLPTGAGWWQRVMGLDLAQRYGQISGDHVDHVCTGNTLYRRSALLEVGLLDEGLGYGYDNDLSYRLGEAGHRLAFCRAARADHHWRAGARAYLAQQYGVGYGRLDLIAKHPRRLGGDQVSGPLMMLHAGGTLAALAALGGAAAAPATAPLLVPTGGALLAALAAERIVAGFRVARAERDPAGLLFPAVHLLRDVAWAGAIVVWSARRVAGVAGRPSHSMSRSDPTP